MAPPPSSSAACRALTASPRARAPPCRVSRARGPRALAPPAIARAAWNAPVVASLLDLGVAHLPSCACLKKLPSFTQRTDGIPPPCAEKPRFTNAGRLRPDIYIEALAQGRFARPHDAPGRCSRRVRHRPSGDRVLEDGHIVGRGARRASSLRRLPPKARETTAAAPPLSRSRPADSVCRSKPPRAKRPRVRASRAPASATGALALGFSRMSPPTDRVALGAVSSRTAARAPCGARCATRFRSTGATRSARCTTLHGRHHATSPLSRRIRRPRCSRRSSAAARSCSAHCAAAGRPSSSSTATRSRTSRSRRARRASRVRPTERSSSRTLPRCSDGHACIRFLGLGKPKLSSRSAVGSSALLRGPEKLARLRARARGFPWLARDTATPAAEALARSGLSPLSTQGATPFVRPRLFVRKPDPQLRAARVRRAQNRSSPRCVRHRASSSTRACRSPRRSYRPGDEHERASAMRSPRRGPADGHDDRSTAAQMLTFATRCGSSTSRPTRGCG